MIDYEKLDKLMELPVSEEMLGAYIEGNLSDVEALDIHMRIDDNDRLNELFREIQIEEIRELTEPIVDDFHDLDNIGAYTAAKKRQSAMVDDGYDDII